MISDAAAAQRLRGKAADIDLDRLARPILAAAIIASGLLQLHLTRGSSFWADDWTWITTRRANTVNAFLAPYNGHLSLVPIAIYRLMFAVFGIGSYLPYRIVVIALDLVVGALVFTYAKSRIGELVALLLAVSMLFLGPGWQDTMWSFQIPWLIVCAAGITALMLAERRRFAADAAVSGLTLLMLCSTSLGLAFAIGIAVDLALVRRRWQDAWILALPFLLYVIWTLHYHPTAVDWSQFPQVPINAAEAAASSLSILTGLSGVAPFNEVAQSLTYGWPLLVLAVLLAARRARRHRPTTRAISVGVILVVFAALVSIVHGALASPLSSRYVYVYCLLAVLLIAETARGVRPPPAVAVVLCALTLVALVSNVGSLRSFGAYLRISGYTTNGALTALALDRSHVPPSTDARIALYSFVKMSARQYFAAERSLGTPAYTLAQLRGANATAQAAADSQLLVDGDLDLRPEPEFTGAGAGPAPSVVAVAGGTVARAGDCVRFTPAAALPPGAIASITLRVAPGTISLSAAAASASVAFRRFAPTTTALGTIAAHGTGAVTIRRDLAADPWYLDVSSIGPVRACHVAP
jgi:hypothetical protein